MRGFKSAGHVESRNKLEMLKLDMLHENEGRTNIFKADHFFQTKLVRGTDIFSENFGPRTVISGTNFPVTELPLLPVSHCACAYSVERYMGLFVDVAIKWLRYPCLKNG